MKKDWIARELALEVVVGAFVLTVLLGLAIFTIILSRDTWLSPKYNLEIVFEEVMGLRAGDSVVVRGMPCGKVKGLELMDDGVHVVASLDEPVEIHEGYRISIMAVSLLGGRQMSIDEGPQDAAVLPQETVLRGEEPYDLIGDAAELMSELRRNFVDGGVVADIRETVARVREIADRVADGKGVLGRLLSEDETLYEDMEATVASLKAVAQRVEQGEGALGRLTRGDSTLVEDLEASAKSLRGIAEKIEQGEGTLGKLMTEDELYNEILEVVDELGATIDDFRETAPVVSFSSIFFGAF